MRTRFLAAGLAAVAAGAVARADPPPSVLVSVVTPKRGALDRTVTAYVTARPALDAATTLSVQLDGAVDAILVTPGEAIGKGQALVEVRLSANAASLYKQAVNALAAAKIGAERTTALLAHHLATRDALAQAERAVADAQAGLDALRREGGGRDTTTVRAPFDGIVTAIPIARGTRLPAGTPLVTLMSLGGLVGTVGLEPGARASVRPGQAATVAPLDRVGTAMPARVIRIDAAIDAQTRLVDADVSIPPDAVLAGEGLVATIVTGAACGWIVPHASVVDDGHGPAVFQVRAGRATRVAVDVVLVSGDKDVVGGPLDPSRPIVVDGSYQLTDGATVRTGGS